MYHLKTAGTGAVPFHFSTTNVSASEPDGLSRLTPGETGPAETSGSIPATAGRHESAASGSPKPDNLLRALVCAGVLGIWALVFQNAEIVKDVHVVNTVDVTGQVGVRGTVDVGNRVDVNIGAINGYNDVFYNIPFRDPSGKYFRLPFSD